MPNILCRSSIKMLKSQRYNSYTFKIYSNEITLWNSGFYIIFSETSKFWRTSPFPRPMTTLHVVQGSVLGKRYLSAYKSTIHRCLNEVYKQNAILSININVTVMHGL